MADPGRWSSIAFDPAGWAVTNDVHVWPRTDLVQHEMSPACPCAPTEEIVMVEEKPSWIWTHHSLDGRERHEVVHGG